MSFARSLTTALNRSLEQAKHSIAATLRMDVVPQTSKQHGRKAIYSLVSEDDVKDMATGCDADMGGVSRMKLELDNTTGKGRFFGTLSNEVPRGAKLERSGYAAFRNRTRPSLFGQHTWDTTLHPFLRLRVRNRLAPPARGTEGGASSSSQDADLLRAALSSVLKGDRNSAFRRAQLALGLGSAAVSQQPGPKYFVNVQTDGPVTSDLFQHRLVLDEKKGNAWQNVTIPLPDFVLINTGEVASTQLEMMRERIRTVGISVTLEPPLLPREDDEGKIDAVKTAEAPSVLKRNNGDDDAQQATGSVVPGSRRAASFKFDLDVDGIEALSEDALNEEIRASRSS